MADARDLAERLRREPPRLDDLARARMERRLLEAARAPAAKPQPSVGRRPFWAGVTVGVAAAAVAAGLWMASGRPAEVAPVVEASFEAFRDGVIVRRGPFSEGEAVETRGGQLVRVAVGPVAAEPRVLVAVEPESRVRFDTLSDSAVELRLDRGRARVEFHPLRRGEESLRVRTPTAIVEVVGTVFEVAVEAGATLVQVAEGVVRVSPLAGGEPTLLRAGQSHRVGGERAGRADDPALGDVTIAARGRPAGEEGSTGRSEAAVRPRRRPAREARADSVEPGQVDPPTAADVRGGQPEAPSVETTPLSDDLRFDLAARYFQQGRWEESRHELYAIIRTSASRTSRTRAWTEVAETFERQGDPSQAAEAYRRAAEVGHGTTLGANALFALGRLRASLHDRDAARGAYRRYLEVAPAGPLAEQAARALCQLGERQRCDVPAPGPR